MQEAMQVEFIDSAMDATAPWTCRVRRLQKGQRVQLWATSWRYLNMREPVQACLHQASAQNTDYEVQCLTLRCFIIGVGWDSKQVVLLRPRLLFGRWTQSQAREAGNRRETAFAKESSVTTSLTVG